MIKLKEFTVSPKDRAQEFIGSFCVDTSPEGLRRRRTTVLDFLYEDRSPVLTERESKRLLHHYDSLGAMLARLEAA